MQRPPLHYSSEPGPSRINEEETRLRSQKREPRSDKKCSYSFIRILTISTIVLGVVAHKMAPPPPPSKLTEGCPPDLLHSNVLKAVEQACKEQPANVVAAFEGVEDALAQCMERMKYQPWDCTEAGNILHDPAILKRGYRESALVWALSAAGAAWGVATACAQGWIPDCSCTSTNGNNQEHFEYGGCSFGVQHGITMSRKLLTKPTVARTSLRAVEKHNLKAGRLAVKKTLISSCRCHGVSGSCQQRTCWKKTANLDHIALYLVEKYSKAKPFIDESSSKNADLVYSEPSPDPCLVRKGGLPRVCAWRNETHSQGDCSRLCCGRGHTVKHEMIQYKCDCKFLWCCSLQCKDCLQHRWVSTCN